MASFSMQKLVALLKKKDIGHSEAARELGLTVGQISSLAFSQALVEAGRVSKAPSTDASVKKLRADGNRFELIAARTGKSVAEVKNILGEGTVRSGSTRGAGSASGGGKSKTKAAAKKGAAKRKTAGAKAKASSARPARRARTLAERRAARAGNPS